MDMFTGGSYLLALYRTVLSMPLNETKILPRCLFEILIEYISFDQNHAIIMYEENDNELQCYRINHRMLNFNKGEICLDKPNV